MTKSVLLLEWQVDSLLRNTALVGLENDVGCADHADVKKDAARSYIKALKEQPGSTYILEAALEFTCPEYVPLFNWLCTEKERPGDRTHTVELILQPMPHIAAADALIVGLQKLPERRKAEVLEQIRKAVSE